MRLTQLFTKTRRQAPKDEAAVNAQLLIRAGFVHKDSAGVYVFLPLGLRVLNKIIGIIREEMNALGGQEILLSSLQRKELWEQTDRWDDKQVDIWFKTKFKNGTEAGLGWSHEEPLTELLREHVSSYRDLPFYTYQFQNKLRNETRAKSGIMRTREFIMKDMYSFSRSKEEHDAFYQKSQGAYTRIFERIGLGEWTYMTFASGGAFAE
ncbi:MAG TPA: aminoacyl--tRNA ligase-related protein, partial [Candidatus Polarisedimenticolaceae bacterium]|nr:aminoacyl--tRNA ligase-related protein [Candidatus Polarisedimenticolaceae bacterium]